MKLKLLSAVITFALCGVSVADSYNAEINGVAQRSQYDMSVYSIIRTNTTTHYGLAGQYYFDAVKTDNVPLAEAAFVGRSSNVFANYGRSFYDFEVWTTGHMTAYGGGVELYVPEQFLYLKINGKHVKETFDDAWITIPNTEYTKNYSITTIGITPIDGLLLTTTWETLDSYRANISAKYVTAIGNGQFINIEANATRHGQKNISGDFYFDKTLSVGVAFIDVTSEDNGFFSDGHKGYELRARKFFTESLSAGVSLAHYENSEDAANLNVSFRF